MTEDSANSPIELTLLDPEIQRCPYPAYETLRNEAPVYRDPVKGFYVVTRYEDVRRVVLETETFSSSLKAGKNLHPERNARIRALYEAKGWVPGPTLSGRAEPAHRELRAVMDEPFRPARIRSLDPYLKETVDTLFAALLPAGECDWVRQFAIPLPLTVICHEMGANPDDIWRIKGWVDAWITRIGAMQTEDEELWSVEMEIEAQHYFQPIFDRLRREPDGTFLSHIVNSIIPEWGRGLNENELHAEMMADTFAAGAETTASAIASGMRLLIENPEIWKRLKSDPEKHVRPFVEEIVRLESPTQGLMRVTAKDVTLHGVTIPAGSLVNARFAAANRDERQFECPEEVDLERRNAATHMAFGAGTHHCMGAPLARRELFITFMEVAERLDEIWFLPGKNDFAVHPSLLLRGLKALHIGFTPSVGH